MKNAIDNKIYVGQKASISKIVRFEDVQKFAELTGDYNYLHFDIEKAKKSILGDRVCHGMLISSYISTVLGTCLPGEGSIYLEQNIRFLKPVYFDEKIEIIVEIEDISSEKGIVTLKTEVVKSNNSVAIIGKAVVLCEDKNIFVV